MLQSQPQFLPISPQSLSEQQLHLQLRQKLQHQQPHQQLLPNSSSQVIPAQLPQPPALLQNHQVQQLQMTQHPQQQQQMSCNSIPMSACVPSQQLPPANNINGQPKPVTTIRALSGLTEGDAPLCSDSPSVNNCHVPPSNFLTKNRSSNLVLMVDSLIEPASNIFQGRQMKPDLCVKHEMQRSRCPDQLKHKSSVTDPLEVSSSATSYCLDASTVQQNFMIPNFCLDNDVQSQPRQTSPFAANMDSLDPDTLLSWGFDSPKDLQNLLFNYGVAPEEIETELSSAAISSQSFGVPTMTFTPGCANDVTINDPGVLKGGIWSNGNQTQRSRTYTKVQKRGSVGRSINITRYRDYNELRRDLARMFGIEGQLEDPQRTDWKLVYMDHENDILLVGDDPWDEFVTCVQSIKILSADEVQQISLDSILGGNVPIGNPASSGTDSGNAWRGRYDIPLPRRSTNQSTCTFHPTLVASHQQKI